MMLLFFSELNTFISPDKTEELFVDTTRAPKLDINLNITVPVIPCQCLSLDEWIYLVGGSFHGTPGQSFLINEVHVHDLKPFHTASFNKSHTIDHLSTGINIPGKTNPLDGTVAISNKDMSQYRGVRSGVQTIVVPRSRYEKLQDNLGVKPPGLFFIYELAPSTAKYTQKKRSFSPFAINVCAIIDGVFTMASLTDGFPYRMSQVFEEKIELRQAF